MLQFSRFNIIYLESDMVYLQSFFFMFGQLIFLSTLFAT